MKKSKSTLFLDESGKATLTDPKYDVFLLTGIILDDEEVNNIESYFSYIKRRFDLNENEPFHSYDIFEGPKRNSLDRNKKLASLIADFIETIPAEITICVVDKPGVKQGLGVTSDQQFKGENKLKKNEVKESPYKIAASTLFHRFAKHLNNQNRTGMIITDSRRGADAQLLKTLELCKLESGPLKEESTGLVKDHVSAICFAEKNYLSGGIEIADLISYTLFFELRNMRDTGKKLGLDELRKVIKQKIKKGNYYSIGEKETRKFFKLKKNEVHEGLK